MFIEISHHNIKDNNLDFDTNIIIILKYSKDAEYRYKNFSC